MTNILFRLFDLEIKKNIYYIKKGQICSKYSRSFGKRFLTCNFKGDKWQLLGFKNRE